MNHFLTWTARLSSLAVAAVIGGALFLGDSPSDSMVAPLDSAVAPPGAAHLADAPPAAITALESAAIAIAEERGRAYVALHAPTPIDTPEHTAIEASRIESGAKLDDALGRIDTMLGIGHLTVQRVHATRRHVAALRAEMDRALTVPREARDTSLARRWFRATTDLIDGIYQSAGFAALWQTRESPPSYGLIALQRDVWRIADVAGRERAMVGAAIASGEPISAAEHEALVGYRNRLTSDWRRLERVASGSHAGPVLVARVERARRALFGDVARARVLVLDASARGADYPFTVDGWFSAASRAIDAVVVLRRDADDPATDPSDRASVPSSIPPRTIAGHTADG